MTRLISSAAVAALAVVTASCAPVSNTAAPGDSASAGTGQQCFNADQVRNFRQGGSGTLYIRSLRNQVFELKTSGGCLGLDMAHQLSITSDLPVGGNRICTGDWARITLPSSAIPGSTCRALVDRVLTDEEVAALPSAHRP
ncbi:MAG: hypothetical protein K0M78_09375 [Brevundimonas sp.]|nr:hypothetical protein [Brevundimonas sp.]